MKKPVGRPKKTLTFGKGLTEQPEPKPEPKPESTDATQIESQESAALSPSIDAAKGFTARESNAYGDRFSFRIIDDKLDLASIRPSKQERIKAVIANTLKDEDSRKWIGVGATAAAIDAPQQDAVLPETVGFVLDLVSQAEAFILAGRTKLPYGKCLDLLRWDAREHQVLDKQGAAVANKYIPPEYLDKMDLWIFLGSILSISIIKMKSVADLAERSTKSEVDKTLDGVERATNREDQRNREQRTPTDKAPTAADVIDIPAPHEESQRPSYEQPN